MDVAGTKSARGAHTKAEEIDRQVGKLTLFERSRLGGFGAEFRTKIRPNSNKPPNVERCSKMTGSEVQLQLIIDTIPSLVWTARPDGFCDFLNQRWLRYTGMNAAQAQGWGWADAIHPVDRKGVVDHWRSCLASGTPVATQVRIRRFDGSYRWFLISANPLRDQSGNIVRWYGTNIDIEDRKRAEESLRARELSWRQIVDNIPGLVATMGAMGEVEFLNRQTLEYFGKTNEELKDWSLIGAVHPDDLPRVIEARTKSIEAEQIYEVEHRCRRADGVYRWFQVRGVPVRNAENEITAWYLLLTDIDDRKKAEEALRSSERNLNLTINAIPAMVGVLRPDGSMLYANQAALDYTGITLEDIPTGDYRVRVYHPEDLERQREERRLAFTRPLPFETEQRVLGKDGRYRWHLTRYNPVLDEQGRIDRWYVAATDIEDRKRAEQELKRSEAFLAEGQRLSRTGSFSWCIETDEITWSEELYRIFEFDERLPVTLQRIASRVYPDDIPLMQDMIERSRHAAADFEYKHRLLMPDQSVKHIHLFAHATRDQHGRLEYVGAAQDVTRQEEERLRRENVRLEERTRIAQELHDTLLQTFLSASMQLDVARDVLPAESSAKPLLDRILEIMRRGIEEGRSTIKGLRSSECDATDLVKALTGVQQELPARQEIDFRVRVAGRQQPLSPLIQQETYRIGREALLNAFCHSGAKRVECELEYADHDLRMRVRDNGTGIDPQVLHDGREGHWGLAGMRERAAKIGGFLNISSSATGGTEVRLSVPSSIAFQISATAKSA